jgi:hypothetical protein
MSKLNAKKAKAGKGRPKAAGSAYKQAQDKATAPPISLTKRIVTK